MAEDRIVMDTNEELGDGGHQQDRPPVNIQQLTIKNLDTGEEFIIGENDPDFDFDTFAIEDKQEAKAEEAGSTEQHTDAANAAAQARISWWRTFFRYIYGSRQDKVDEKMATMADDAAPNKPKTPFTKLSSFKFRKELGKGAFGRVLLAEARTDGQLYALKIISKKNMRSSDRRQAKAERDILHAMTLKAPHPFTSGLKFAFQSENNLYLGMDYIPGGNLRELIKRFKFLPEDWVRFYAAELVLAISHLHSMNVLYRDIKPHNVMIDARGHVILIDFGLSKQEISHPRGALSLVGTPDYSAPEVLRTGVQQIEAHNREKAARANGAKKKKGKRSEEIQVTERLSHIGYGKAADWWSLGIMIYEMLAGKPTFRGQDLRETYQRILYAKLEFVPEERFSPAAMSLLEGLINRDPSLRLGAWDNPPRDIMSSPFFESVEWDGIYDRHQDGPWLPEVPGYVASAMRKASVKPRDSLQSFSPMKDSSLHGVLGPAAGQGERRRLTFSPPPMDRYTPISDLELAKAGQPQRHVEAAAPAPRRGDEERREAYNQDDDEGNEDGDDNNGNDDDDDDAQEDGDDDDYEEELHIRDSVFFTREDIQNRLPDWSYIDANVLMNYLNDEENKEAREDGNNASAGGKKKKGGAKDQASSNKMKKIIEEAKEMREKAKEESRRSAEAVEKNSAAADQPVSSPTETLQTTATTTEGTEEPSSPVEASQT